jgi:hypothetical protein
MSAEIDYNLTPDQWEVLKALRAPAPQGRIVNRVVVEDLVVLQLVELIGENPVITPRGRSVLLRGSPQLWDVAA